MMPECAGRERYANATERAPRTISSSTLAAPTILAPLVSCSSVMLRGLTQAPHSQTSPPLPTNSASRSLSAGRPGELTPSAPCAGGGLIRIFVSDYLRLKKTVGLSHYTEAAMAERLKAAGFRAERARRNIGHNQWRMTFLGRPA